MKLLTLPLIAICLLSLTGCPTMGPLRDQEVAVKYKYVVTSIPVDLTTVPPATVKIDPKTATDKEMAKWMADSEARYLEIEKRLKAIKDYQENKLKDLKIPAEDIIKN